MAVLGGRQHLALQVDPPELCDVVDHNEVGVEVYYAFHGVRYQVGQVDAGIVQRLVEGLPDGPGYFPLDPVRVEPVDPEVEEREGGAYAGGDLRVGPHLEEVELEVLGAHRVLQDRQDRRHGAPEVVLIQGHRDVDLARGAASWLTSLAVVVDRCLTEDVSGCFVLVWFQCNSLPGAGLSEDDAAEAKRQEEKR